MCLLLPMVRMAMGRGCSVEFGSGSRFENMHAVQDGCRVRFWCRMWWLLG